jgi:hypothetical protein
VIRVKDVHGFTMRNGSVGPSTECMNSDPGCSGQGTDSSRIGSDVNCGSQGQNCTNITFDNVLFYNDRTCCNSAIHTELLRVDGGNGILFNRTKFLCPDSTGCQTGAFFLSDASNQTFNGGAGGPRNLTIRNSFFPQNACCVQTIDIQGEVSASAKATWRWEYNTIAAGGQHQGKSIGGSGSPGGVFIGNLIYGRSGDSQLCAGSRYRHNVFWTEPGRTAAKCGSSDHRASGAASNDAGAGLFVSPSASVGNLHLRNVAGNPARNRGDPRSYPSGDIDGSGRPVGSGPDAGADEAGFRAGSVACVVPYVVGKPLAKAKTRIVYAHCRVGTVTRVPSRKKKQTVVGESPRPGKRLKKGARVNLKVSHGR